MKTTALLILLFTLNLSFAQSNIPNPDLAFERYTPENIKWWIDEGNDPNKIIGEGADSHYCVYWAFTNHLGLYCDSAYTEAIFYMIKNSKFPIDDALYFITDPCDVGIDIMQYLRLTIQNKHIYEPAELQYVSYFIRAKDTDYGKANLSTKDTYGNVLIVLAAEFQLKPIFDFAMKLKANVNLTDNNGMTALHFAIKNGNKKMTNKLIAAGANVNTVNNAGDTPFILAASSNNSEVIAKLVAANADLNVVNSDGDTPLILAAKNGDWKTVKFLAQQGAIVKTKNKAGEKAANFADSKMAKKALKGK
ncbi:MAG: ankyrin repeat protein [Crocinitomix sp.]|jgi:ankyrin repeat protein